MILYQSTTELQTGKEPGVCFVDSADLDELITSRPEKMTVLARGASQEYPTVTTISLGTRTNERRAVLRSSWPADLDPWHCVWQCYALAESLGYKGKPAVTIGAAAGKILDAYLKRNGRRHPGFLPRLDLSSLEIAAHLRGGIQIAPRTVIEDAAYLDMVQAYRWAMDSAHPEGQPIRKPDISPGRLERLINNGGCVYVWCELDARELQRPLLLWAEDENPTYPRDVVPWHGSGPEYLSLLEAGVKPLGRASIDIYRPSHVLSGLMTRIEKDFEPALAKAVYRAIWPKLCPSGGWRGVMARDPGDLDRDCKWRQDHGLPWLWWTYDGWIDKMPDWYRLCRPELAAWIPGQVRARIIPIAHRYDVGQVLVDAVIVDGRSADEIQQGDKPGDFRLKARGCYLGAGPGQYVCGDRLGISGVQTSLHSIETLQKLAWSRTQRNGIERPEVFKIQEVGNWPDVRIGWERERTSKQIIRR